ncbi:twin-arginine translocation signal domain-containing protein [Haloarcula sp. JP-Z28]|nr:twin-arginine translocation signal domain-containing protein [Haloarcula sp. JP-Z28]NHX41057.1 twin-arginine translocation signal domain-containing protein [Haloarcula sp. R1-2]
MHMSEQTRRDLLKRLGVGSTAGVVSLAGCAQQSDEGGGDGGSDGEMTATEAGD